MPATTIMLIRHAEKPRRRRRRCRSKRQCRPEAQSDRARLAARRRLGAVLRQSERPERADPSDRRRFSTTAPSSGAKASARCTLVTPLEVGSTITRSTSTIDPEGSEQKLVNKAIASNGVVLGDQPGIMKEYPVDTPNLILQNQDRPTQK